MLPFVVVGGLAMLSSQLFVWLGHDAREEVMVRRTVRQRRLIACLKEFSNG